MKETENGAIIAVNIGAGNADSLQCAGTGSYYPVEAVGVSGLTGPVNRLDGGNHNF